MGSRLVFFKVETHEWVMKSITGVTIINFFKSKYNRIEKSQHASTRIFSVHFCVYWVLTESVLCVCFIMGHGPKNLTASLDYCIYECPKKGKNGGPSKPPPGKNPTMAAPTPKRLRDDVKGPWSVLVF